MIAIVALVVAAGPLFDVHAISLTRADADLFLAPANDDAIADVFVLEDRMLTAYSPSTGQKIATITFEQGVSAFDVVDIEGTSAASVIAVQGDTVLRYVLRDSTNPNPPQRLFEVKTALATPAERPFPYVIGLQRDGVTLLSLPRDNELTLYTLSGEVVETLPVLRNVKNAVFTEPFRTWIDRPNRFGPAGALEMRVSFVEDFSPAPPFEISDDAKSAGVVRREASIGRLQDAALLGSSVWPWFPVFTSGDPSKRALFTLSSPDFRDTVIRIRDGAVAADTESDESRQAAMREGPERRYPGIMLDPGEDLPDFNGDGYTDMLLWTAREPGTSVSALANVLVQGVWNMRVNVHRFMPEKNRYDPRPSGSMSFDVPISWFYTLENAAPLRNVVLRDFNGDGHTDCAWSTGDDTFAAWIYDDGFGARPTFTRRFPERITRIELSEEMDGSGRTSVIVRGQNSIYILYASP